MSSSTAPFSPIALVGTIALLTAYLVAAWCVAAGIAGNAIKSRRLVNSAVYGLYGFGALIGVASALMIYAFVTHDFAIKYVASTSDVTMSTWYKVTAFWGGLDGSLLFWVLVLALFSTIAIAMNARRHRDMIGYVVATIMVVQVFFISLLIFTKNPFATYLTSPPVDGQGLNPLLQNYWMVIHPPSLYIGFVAATIPFAFGIGALASGRLDDMWLGSVRVWMLICFGFLSLGLILGGRWAYEELGWGGYWAWDPVENAGFMPWFTATAFLHSAIIQEQRGGMKIWNMTLVVLTFFLTIFGTFMTRSGIVQSVHAFGEDNVLALQFVLFMAVVLIVSIGLIVYRAPKLSTKTYFDSFMSREFAFLVNNWILLICAFAVLFLTMFPTISESLGLGRVSVGIPFFNNWMTPFGLILIFLAGAAPLLAWRKTTTDKLVNQFMIPLGAMILTIVVCLIVAPQTMHLSSMFHDVIQLPVSLINFGLVAFGVASIGQEFIRGAIVRCRQTGSDPFTAMIGLVIAKRRKYGGYIVHLGVLVMFVGFAGKAYDRQIDKTLEKPAIAEGIESQQTPQQKVAWALAYLDLDSQTQAALKNGQIVPTKEFAERFTTKAVPKSTKSTFDFGDYTFVYERIIHTSDDHKDAVTSQMSIYLDGENIGTVYPAKWDYRKGSEATTEVAIRVRMSEDVYVVLTGYDLDSQLANFRVYINPLISWVWIGFLILALGTLICLIPQSLVDALMGRGGPKSPVGQIGRVLGVLFVAGALVATTAHTAHAQNAGEHVPANMGMGDAGVGYAAQNRPNSETAKKAMQELLCVCGCPRESIFDCKCATAAKLRGKVLDYMATQDLKSDAGRDRAYAGILDSFVKEYGGEQVLATPRSKATWILPTLAVVGGLGLLVAVGKSLISRGKVVAAKAPSTELVEDDNYADKLDDELAKTGD
ncbi:MAG TPA: cytochrome c-type biogenesis CcmF C-terminal domain-containing protein [Kofleriaceae bacterium]|nr:cytochrome c-type biogenesis CcmF C-terminal domain-containing protein [Kofleriaceae bacterium]